jgi:hypothetical protein
VPTPTEVIKSAPVFQASPTTQTTASAEQPKQITTVNSWEEVQKHLPMQTFRDFVFCGICQYKDKVRSNLLNHMKSHADGGLTISQNIVNPVPRIGKDQTDLMFNKMSNHAGYTAGRSDDDGSVKPKDEVS